MTLSSFRNRLMRWRQKSKPRDAFWELAASHTGFLYHLAYKYTGNRFDAEDLVQETLTIAFKQFHQLRDSDKFRSWMFTILRRSYLKDKRQKAPVEIDDYDNGMDYLTQLADSATQSDVSLAYEKKVADQVVQTILNRMPEKYKTVLILYYMQDHSYQDIADTLKVPMGTVMSRLSRAKQAMKKALLRHRLQAENQSIQRRPAKR